MSGPKRFIENEFNREAASPDELTTIAGGGGDVGPPIPLNHSLEAVIYSMDPISVIAGVIATALTDN